MSRRKDPAPTRADLARELRNDRLRRARENLAHCQAELAHPSPAFSYVNRGTWEHLAEHWQGWIDRLTAPPAPKEADPPPKTWCAGCCAWVLMREARQHRDHVRGVLERGRKRCREEGRPARDACPCGVPGHYVCPTDGIPPEAYARGER